MADRRQRGASPWWPLLAAAGALLAGLLVLVVSPSVGFPATTGLVHESSAFALDETPISSPEIAARPVTALEVLVSVGVLGVMVLLAVKYRGSPRATWLVVAFSLLLSVRYLTWRGLYTLNTMDGPLSLGLSLAVFAAELYGFGGSLLFYLQIASPIRRDPRTPNLERLPTVDVFVTICNEPLDILRRTLVACRALDYPSDRKTVYVLDDGGRPEVRELAESMGCVYVHRPDRDHAKAGNLNFALARSSGEIIVNFDTDHVPVRTFLMETIGHFEDPNVALVQTPHHFYNPDLFQRNLRLEREIVNEQDLFFQLVQPGRDGHNSVFFCGSGGLFRRAALERVGGFATQTVTEDIHTSVLLHAKGYRTVYVNKRLAAGLAPEDYASYLRQRQRWTRGHIQLFFSPQNPLFVRKLTLAQRLDYFASIYYFLHGPARLVYLVAPLAFLVGGKYVVVADLFALLTFYIAHYVGVQLAATAATRGFRNPFWADVYETVMSFHLTLTTMSAMFFIKPSAFHVTPKGRRAVKPSFQWRPSLPYLSISVALGVGIALGLAHIVRAGYAETAAVVSLLWAGYNVVICAAATLAARERPQRREAPRLACNLACELGVGHTVLPARTFDLSETGLSVWLNPPRSLPPHVDIRLYGDEGDTMSLKGRVVRNDRVGERDSFVGIAFADLSERERRSLIRQMFCPPSSWLLPPVIETPVWRSLLGLVGSTVRVFAPDRALRRLAPRFTLGIPCEIISRDEVVGGMTVDMSETGLLIRSAAFREPAKGPCVVRLTPGTDFFTLRGRVVWHQTRRGARYVGIRCEEPLSRFLITWIEFVQKSSNGQRGRREHTPIGP